MSSEEKKDKLLKELMLLVRAIPYYCGNKHCNNYGCLAIREAREKVIEIVNQYPELRKNDNGTLSF